MTSDQMDEHYRAVLRDLEQRQLACQKELAELEQTISAIRNLLPSAQPQLDLAANRMMRSAQDNASGKYANMSVRWAVLNLLAENAPGPMPTSEIASSLLKGGIRSSSRNFNSNVSAVLSTMANTREEVETVEGNYKITEHGREVWNAIKLSEPYRTRNHSSVST